MLSFSSPPTYQVPSTGNLTDDVVDAVRIDPQRPLLAREVEGGWEDVSAERFRDEVAAVAKGLLAAGIAPGDRVGLLSATRYEWTLLDYAIWWVGATTVPIYETSSTDQVSWILEDSEATACVVEDNDHLARVHAARAGASALHHVWSIEGGAVAALTTLGGDVDDDELEVRRSQVGPHDLATVIYTSGTTGRPKGCRLTHGNFMFELGVAVDHLDVLFEDDDAATLLFLPLAHVFARIIQIAAIKSGTKLGHSADIKNLSATLRDFRPTFVLAVPRVFEKVYNSASQSAVSSGRGKIFDRATEVAIAYSQAQETTKGPGFALRAKHGLFDRLVYGKLRAALGGRARYALAGGAPLGERLAHFFRGVGVPVLEGYGLTETTAALAVNVPGTMKIGTVGRPMPGTEVRVAEDGELLFRGGQVFDGYWRNDTATAEALEEDGWFHTGDVGEIDDEGFVRITGRKKEIIVTAGGKNVAPAVLEDSLRAHVLVSQCLVVGDGKPFIGAVVTIDDEAFTDWRASNDKRGTVADHVRDPDLLAEIQAAVDTANSRVSKAESIRKFTILPTDWSEEAGQITPTLKVKRNNVLRDYHDDIESLYT